MLVNFFKKIREINLESEGIFSKVPRQVFGNISCCNNNENALGYFFASAVKTKRIFIDRFEHNVTKSSAYNRCGWHEPYSPRYSQHFYGKTNAEGLDIWSTNIFCTDCRIRGANIKPDFWED